MRLWLIGGLTVSTAMFHVKRRAAVRAAFHVKQFVRRQLQAHQFRDSWTPPHVGARGCLGAEARCP